MSKCHVPMCTSKIASKKTRGQENAVTPTRISFHRFPVNEILRRKWLKFLGQPTSMNTRDFFVCSRHFSPECLEDYGVLGENMQRRRLRQGGRSFTWLNV